MLAKAYRNALFACYQVAVLVGILAMPVALLARRAGLRFPIGRFVDSVGAAYENAAN